MHDRNDFNEAIRSNTINKREWETPKHVLPRIVCIPRRHAWGFPDLGNSVFQLSNTGVRINDTSIRLPILSSFDFFYCIRMKPDRRFWHSAFLRAVFGLLPMELLLPGLFLIPLAFFPLRKSKPLRLLPPLSCPGFLLTSQLVWLDLFILDQALP